MSTAVVEILGRKRLGHTREGIPEAFTRKFPKRIQSESITACDTPAPARILRAINAPARARVSQTDNSLFEFRARRTPSR